MSDVCVHVGAGVDCCGMVLQVRCFGVGEMTKTTENFERSSEDWGQVWYKVFVQVSCFGFSWPLHSHPRAAWPVSVAYPGDVCLGYQRVPLPESALVDKAKVILATPQISAKRATTRRRPRSQRKLKKRTWRENLRHIPLSDKPWSPGRYFSTELPLCHLRKTNASFEPGEPRHVCRENQFWKIFGVPMSVGFVATVEDRDVMWFSRFDACSTRLPDTVYGAM